MKTTRVKIRLDIFLLSDAAYQRANPGSRDGERICIHSQWVDGQTVENILIIAAEIEVSWAWPNRRFTLELSKHEVTT